MTLKASSFPGRLALVLIDFLFGCANQQLTVKDVYLSYLPLAHIFDRVIEECFIQHGAAIGFWRGVSTA